MLEEVECCKNYENHLKKAHAMSKENKIHFRKANKCQMCNKLYSEQDIRVKDYCHITGEYRGLAHEIFNVSFQLKIKIPVISHNLSLFK